MSFSICGDRHSHPKIRRLYGLLVDRIVKGSVKLGKVRTIEEIVARNRLIFRGGETTESSKRALSSRKKHYESLVQEVRGTDCWGWYMCMRVVYGGCMSNFSPLYSPPSSYTHVRVTTHPSHSVVRKGGRLRLKRSPNQKFARKGPETARKKNPMMVVWT